MSDVIRGYKPLISKPRTRNYPKTSTLHAKADAPKPNADYGSSFEVKCHPICRVPCYDFLINRPDKIGPGGG